MTLYRSIGNDATMADSDQWAIGASTVVGAGVPGATNIASVPDGGTLEGTLFVGVFSASSAVGVGGTIAGPDIASTGQLDVYGALLGGEVYIDGNATVESGATIMAGAGDVVSIGLGQPGSITLRTGADGMDGIAIDSGSALLDGASWETVGGPLAVGGQGPGSLTIDNGAPSHPARAVSSIRSVRSPRLSAPASYAGHLRVW